MKKKAIKIAAATAVAASAFVAAAPLQSNAASNVQTTVDNAVKSMQVAYHTYSDVTAKGQFADINTVYAAFNKAKTAYTSAKALVQKAGGAQKDAYLAKLDSNYQTLIAKRVVTYIDAYNYAVNNLEANKDALQAAIDAKNLDNVQKSYNEISYQLNKRTVILDRVYGKTTRELLRSSFKADAQALKESMKYDVTVAVKVKAVNDAVTANQLEVAKKAVEAINANLSKVSDTFKADLTTKANAAIAAYEAVLTPAVDSVSAINATQVEIHFNKAMDSKTIFADVDAGTLNDNTVSFRAIDNQYDGNVPLTGSLSDDGKTLTVTSEIALSKRFDVTVDNLKAKDGKDLTKYQQVVTIAADTTAPTIVSTTKTSASTFVVKFSEPLSSLGTASYKLANGDAVEVDDNFVSGAQEVTFTLNDAKIAAGKEVTATFIGAQDQAGNLLTPNPATASFIKGDKDGVAPTVASITQTGAKTFAVKFSEKLLSTPEIAVSNNDVTKVVKDSTDPTVYNVTVANALDEAQTVTVTAPTDLSGETAASNYSRVVTFTMDTANPKVVSSAVVTDSKDKKQYLEITFDKDVVVADGATVAASGSFVKDYVTNLTGDLAGTVAYKDADVSKKVVRVQLDSLLGTDTDVKGAVYSLDLTFAGVTSGADKAADTAKASFTRGEDGVAANSDVLGVTGVTQYVDNNNVVNNNKVVVAFDRAVDGASATTVANYSIAGAVVQSVTLNPADANGQTAILNLKAGSNTFTGVRNVNISGVKALGSSKVMNAYSDKVTLNENVAPTVTSAKLTAVDTITLTFSEAVESGVQNDFDLLIGGKSLADNAGNYNAVVSGDNAKTATITITPVQAADLSKGLSLKALTDLDITDLAGNTVSVPSNISVSN